MWNTFDQSKNVIRDHYNSYHFRNGLSEGPLKEKDAFLQKIWHSV